MHGHVAAAKVRLQPHSIQIALSKGRYRSEEGAVTTALSPLHAKEIITMFSFIEFGIICVRARLEPRPQLSKGAVTTVRND